MASMVMKNVKMPYMEAFDRLYKTISIYGTELAITCVDPQSGYILFESSVTLTDWGFNFRAQLRTIDPTTTQIIVTSSPKFGFDIFGVGKRKMEEVLFGF